MGTIDPTQIYTLFYSAAGTPWDISGASFTFNGVPSGYAATEMYNAPTSGNESVTVSFGAVPEPSDWALMGVGAVKGG
jgi:hypothetical protein